jgi:hypothetical protein
MFDGACDFQIKIQQINICQFNRLVRLNEFSPTQFEAKLCHLLLLLLLLLCLYLISNIGHY